MRARFWIQSIVIFIFITLLDQTSKYFIENLSISDGQPLLSLGWLEIAYHQNKGIFGGALSDLHPSVGRVLFSSLYGLLFTLACLLLYFLEPKKLPKLHWGIVLYASGILGNTWDRIWKGAVTDFITVYPGSSQQGMAINLADLAMAFGIITISFSLIADYKKIWLENDSRRTLLIERSFQFGFSALLGLVGFVNFLVVTLFSVSFLKANLATEHLTAPSVQVEIDSLIRDFLIGLGLIEICFILIVVFSGIVFSHRMIGPIYAFERFIEELLSRSSSVSTEPPKNEFRLRRADHFKSLEKLAAMIEKRLRNP